MKRKMSWGRVKHYHFFKVKIFLKSFLEKTKISVSICSLFHIAPLSPTVGLGKIFRHVLTLTKNWEKFNCADSATI
jgi:hypothetical protein